MIKNALIIALAVICVVLYFWKGGKVEQAEKTIAKDEQAQKQIQAEVEILAKKFDEAGAEHATVKAKNEIKPEQASYVGVLDTAAMRIGIQAKQIENLLSINARLEAKNLRAVRVIDSLGKTVFTYRDKYVNLAFRPPTLREDTIFNDDAAFDLAYDIDLQTVQYQKRNWFLGAKRSYIDISVADPRATIQGVKRLTIKQDQPEFGLRAQAMSTYSFGSKNISIGPAVRFDLKRFSIQGAYLYHPPAFERKPTFVIAGSYDAFRF